MTTSRGTMSFSRIISIIIRTHSLNPRWSSRASIRLLFVLMSWRAVMALAAVTPPAVWPRDWSFEPASFLMLCCMSWAKFMRYAGRGWVSIHFTAASRLPCTSMASREKSRTSSMSTNPSWMNSRGVRALSAFSSKMALSLSAYLCVSLKRSQMPRPSAEPFCGYRVQTLNGNRPCS